MKQYVCINNGIVVDVKKHEGDYYEVDDNQAYDVIYVDLFDKYKVGDSFNVARATSEENITETNIGKLAILNSGGLDSLALCEFIHTRKVAAGITDLVSLYIDVGLEVSNDQRKSASDIAKFFNIPHREIFINFGIDTSHFREALGPEYVDPYGAGNIPYPTMTYLSVAFSMARMLGMNAITTGDRNGNNGWRNEFYERIEEVIKSSRLSQRSVLPDVKLIGLLPSYWSYQEVYDSIQLGKSLISGTVSCLKSVPRCGICHKCADLDALIIPEGDKK